MLFFRVILCVAGLLLYLLIREFSDQPAVGPAGQDALRQVPAPAIIEATPAVTPWDSAKIRTFPPVTAKPAQVP
jgi:hypothetical protein